MTGEKREHYIITLTREEVLALESVVLTRAGAANQWSSLIEFHSLLERLLQRL